MVLLRRILEWAWALLLITGLLLRYVYKVDIQHYHLKDIFLGVQYLLIAVYLYLFIRREFFPAKEQPGSTSPE